MTETFPWLRKTASHHLTKSRALKQVDLSSSTMTLAKMSSRMEIQRIQNYVQTTGYSEGQESQIRLLQTTSKRVLWKINPRLTCTRMMGKEMLQACTLSVRQNQKKTLKTLSFFMYLYPNLRYINYFLFSYFFIYFWVCFVFCRVMEESPQHHLSTSSGAKQTANVHLL